MRAAAQRTISGRNSGERSDHLVISVMVSCSEKQISICIVTVMPPRLPDAPGCTWQPCAQVACAQHLVCDAQIQSASRLSSCTLRQSVKGITVQWPHRSNKRHQHASAIATALHRGVLLVGFRHERRLGPQAMNMFGSEAYQEASTLIWRPDCSNTMVDSMQVCTPGTIVAVKLVLLIFPRACSHL